MELVGDGVGASAQAAACHWPSESAHWPALALCEYLLLLGKRSYEPVVFVPVARMNTVGRSDSMEEVCDGVNHEGASPA